jgi:hypothetical protein
MLYISISFTHLSFLFALYGQIILGKLQENLERVEVNSFLCFIGHHTMSMWGNGAIVPCILKFSIM